MNDITALMATMKTAAIRAKAATEDYLAHRMSYTTYMGEIEEFVDLVDGSENVLALVEALEKAQQRIAELERMESALRPVGVMSQAAYHRLENRESRFIALWPRPEIYLPRKRPDDGVIVYARIAGIQVIEGEGQ
ncbi:hypothetical protein [Kluyvera georgiana]|uniref:hypothetical protein n=1 Tax=Kluyvera georgiana TaxID=73098 RepID=UPI003AF19F4D